MNLNKIMLVARYEFMQNLRRKSFLFTAFVLPLIIIGSMYIAIQLSDASENNLDGYQQVGYVDESGIFADFNDPDFERFVPYTSEAEARAAFNTEDIPAYIVIPADYLQTGSISYFSSKSIPVAMRGQIDNFLRTGIAVLAPSDTPLERLRDPMNEEIQILGETEALEESAAISRFLLPMVLTVLLSITILTTTQFLMSGVVEEKENRIAEILLTSGRAAELMLGKLIGLGVLALLQVGFMLGLGLASGAASGRLDVLADAKFAPMDIVISTIYFFLSFILFSGIMLSIGAAVSAEAESRQFAAVFTILFISPVYFIVLFINNPTGIVPTILSLFPFTAPVTTLLLMSFGDVRVWQVVLSISIMILTIVAVLWASSKIFRRGILMYDQRLSLRQLRSILGRG